MNKPALLRAIITKLKAELSLYHKAAQAAYAEATHEQSKAENKYDTRGLEASSLARGQSRQALEIERAIKEFEALRAPKFAPGDPIQIGAVVELKGRHERFFYFIGPRAGGTEVEYQQRRFLVITPQSPLGGQLMGRTQGENLQMEIAGARNQYEIVAVS